MKTNKTMSPILIIGLLINAIYIITNRFIVVLPDWIAMPVLLIDIVLILVGLFITISGLRPK